MTIGAKLMAALACATLPASAQAQPGTPPAPGYVLPSTQMWEMQSASGEPYRIFLSFPKGEAPAGGYPVLYVLDGNASFASFAETRRLLEYYDLGKALIVGVGYPGDEAYHARRSADFLYPPPAPRGSSAPPPAGPGANGRDRFLDFLTGALRAEIGKRFPIDRDRQSLFGHSFGGLFALHALYARPDAFQSIVIASPSLGWNTQEMLREERGFAAGLRSGRIVRMSRVMVVVGAQDSDDDPEPARALASRLDLLSGYGLNSRFLRYEDEIHITVPARTVTDTLRFVFR